MVRSDRRPAALIRISAPLLALLAVLLLGATAAATPVASSASVGIATIARAAPPPWAIPAGPVGAAPALHTTHYWAGAYFTGKARSTHQVAMTIRVPDALPSTSEFYYVLLSVWDSAGSYDQVGFTNDYGHWGFTYSYTTACAGTYYYNPSYATLTRGATYTFTMNLTSTGSLTFAARHGTTYVTSITKHSGGSYFLDQSFYSCNSASYYDYTDYEEIYYSVQSMPSFDYFFKLNTQDNKSVTAWSSMGAPPGGGQIGVSGSQVLVENEAFSVAFASGIPHSAKLPSGTTSYASRLVIGSIFNGTNVSLQLLGGAGVFNATFTPAGGAPGFTSNVSFGITVPAHGVQYTLTLEATDTGGSYAYVTLQLTVL